MEAVESRNIAIVIKNDNDEVITIKNVNESPLKSSELKADYFINVQELHVDDEQDTHFHGIPNEAGEDFVAMEAEDSNQIIIPDKEVILWEGLCRICANESDRFIQIFSGEGVEHELISKIHTHLPIKVSEDDNLPHQVCYTCAATVVAWHDLQSGCIDAQNRLIELKNEFSSKREYLDDSTAGEEDNIHNAEEDEIHNDKQDEGGSESNIEEMEIVDISSKGRSRNFQKVVIELFESKNKTKDDVDKNVTKALNENTSDEKNHCLSVPNLAKFFPKLIESIDPLEVTLQDLESVSTSDSVNKNREDKRCNTNKKEETDLPILSSNEKGIQDELNSYKILKNQRKKSKLKSNNSETKTLETKSNLNNSEHKIQTQKRKKNVENNGKNIKPSKKRKEEKQENNTYNCSKTKTLKTKSDVTNGNDRIKTQKRKKNVENNSTETKSSKKRKEEKQENYACGECGRLFKFKDSYKRHLRIHNDERYYTCFMCGKQFRDSGGLCRHLKAVHDGVKNFACEKCGRSFASKSTRDDHQRIHTGERPYVCTECGKDFKSKASLYIHSKTHTDEFPYPCLQCDKKFRRKQELLSHLSTHTGEKNFECSVCFRRFRVNSELKRHILVHSTELPVSCDLCDFRCRQKRYLNNHVKQKHSIKVNVKEQNA